VNPGINNRCCFTLPADFFLIASFIYCYGTSVGAIVAIGPIASLADKAEPLYLNFGALLGGSMLGDNLSMISDTTIAATQSLGCDLKINLRSICYAFLPALFTILVFST
jgi:Na+/H+ antiporter NhaC